MMLETVRGVRTSAWTGVSRNVFPRACLFRSGIGNLWLRLIDGVTGFESIRVAEYDIERCPDWNACWGTDMRWDRLVIDGPSLALAIARLEESDRADQQ